MAPVSVAKDPMLAAGAPPVDYLRHWRQHRRLSQLDLAQEAEISTRHLSFVETGRSLPSREMVLRLAERLDIPLRERNALLVAANSMLPHLLAGADSTLLQGRINVLRLSLHPQGLAPKIVNLAQWRNHLFFLLSGRRVDGQVLRKLSQG